MTASNECREVRMSLGKLASVPTYGRPRRLWGGGGGIQKKENNQQDVIVNVLVKQNILTCLVQSVFRDFPFLTFNQAKHDNNVLPRCFGCSF